MKYVFSKNLKKIISVLEVFLYFLPIVHYNYSYETYNETTGEYGTEHVRGMCNLFQWVSGSNVFMALLILGVLLAVLAVILNFSKERFSEKYSKSGKWMLIASSVYLIGIYLTVIVLFARTA